MTNALAESEIRLLLDRQEAAWNEGDGAAYAADVTEDAWMTNIVGQTHTGKEAFATRHQHVFDTVFRGSRLTLEVLRLRLLTPEVAMVETKATVRDFRGLPPGAAAGPDGALHTRLLQVLVKEGGQWRGVAYHNVDVKPQGERT